MPRNDELVPGVASDVKQTRVVLCIDDDEAMLRTLSLYLRAYGFKALTESSNWPVIESITNSKNLYAVVIDYAMPHLSAADICTNLRLAHPELPIVMFSGMIDGIPTWVLRIVDTYVRKSDGFDALVAALDCLPRLKRKQQPVRRFPRYSVQLPIELTLGRPDGSITLRGFTTNFSEGGFGGRFDGDVRSGELVSIAIGEPQLHSLQARAQMRSQCADVYGFEFLGLDSQQQATIRACCERLTFGRGSSGATSSA